MKKKLLFMGFLSYLLLVSMIQISRSPVISTIVSGSNFGLEIGSGSSLGFQGDFILQINVTSGVLNASSTSISMTQRRGTLRFVALNNTELEVGSPDAEAGYDLSITGANQTTSTGRFTYDVTVNTGDSVLITWGWRLESWLDKYTMLAIGISGLLMMVASPSWVAWQLRKGGIKPEDFERMMYGMLIFCVGFGLLVMWLWS